MNLRFTSGWTKIAMLWQKLKGRCFSHTVPRVRKTPPFTLAVNGYGLSTI